MPRCLKKLDSEDKTISESNLDRTGQESDILIDPNSNRNIVKNSISFNQPIISQIFDIYEEIQPKVVCFDFLFKCMQKYNIHE